MAIVAMQLLRVSSEARKMSYLERVKPAPQIATGHPPGGLVHSGSGGVTTTNPTVSLPCTAGAPPAVAVCGIRRSAVIQDGASKEPNPTKPASPGMTLLNTSSVGVLTLPSLVRVPATPGAGVALNPIPG